MKYSRLILIIIGIGLVIYGLYAWLGRGGMIWSSNGDVAPRNEQLNNGQDISPTLNALIDQGTDVPWSDTARLIRAGWTKTVVENSNLNVLVTMADGRSFTSREPARGTAKLEITRCGQLCVDTLFVAE